MHEGKRKKGKKKKEKGEKKRHKEAEDYNMVGYLLISNVMRLAGVAK